MRNFEMPKITETKEVLPQEPPQELSEKFLENEEAGMTGKIKNVLNILRPHQFNEAIYKITGALGIVAGLDMSRIAFLNPEQMNILGRELSSGEISVARLLAVVTTLMGGIALSGGIREAIDINRVHKEIEAERKKSSLKKHSKKNVWKQ